MATERKSFAEMLGELFREAGVLVGVFLPLDMIFSGKALPWGVLLLGVLIFLRSGAWGLQSSW